MSGSVSMIDGHIDEINENNENTCVCCGASIPEGRMICPNCEKGMTNESNETHS